MVPLLPESFIIQMGEVHYINHFVSVISKYLILINENKVRLIRLTYILIDAFTFAVRLIYDTQICPWRKKGKFNPNEVQMCLLTLDNSLMIGDALLYTGHKHMLLALDFQG